MSIRLRHVAIFALVATTCLVVTGNTPTDAARQRRNNAAAAEAAEAGFDLLSRRGERFVGDQLTSFAIAPDGSLSTPRPAWISLYYTENKPFELSGEVWLGGADEAMMNSGDLPDGFALFLREWDGMRRYSLTSRGADVKRRLQAGEQQTGITHAVTFEPARSGRWIPFQVSSNWNETRFKFGRQTATLEGPLDMDGANKIAIAPGTKLRNLRLALFTPEAAR